MVEESNQSISPQELLALKDDLLAQWERLPVEHQATMLLVLASRIQAGDYGPWAVEAIRLLSARSETPPSDLSTPPISTTDLIHHTGLTPDEIARLSSADLRRISVAVMRHLVHDVFWDEVEHQVRRYLEGAR